MGENAHLRVAEVSQQDVGLGAARLDNQTRQRLKVGIGDIVEIRGRKTTPAVVSRAPTDDEGKALVRVEAVVRRNAGVSIGDRVQVTRIDCPLADAITIAPIYAGSSRMDLGPGLDAFVQKALARRPFVRGDVFVIPGVFLMGGSLPFMVVSTQPKGIVQVAPSTLITIKEETVSETEVSAPRISYEDIGGLKEKLGRVREMIELPLKHPELFDRLAITPPKGVLLYGPPGTGKTLIAKAVANEAGAHFIGIQGPEIISKYYGESEKELREKFEEAEKNAPSVIFIDELDSIAPRRDEVVGEVERRVVAQLLTLMDGLSGRGNVIVIGATNREEAIDPALRRPGRFDREIEIGVPTQAGRLEILQIHTRGMPIEGTERERERTLRELAALSHGFVGADLSALAREAAMRALRRYLPEIDFDQPIPISLLERMKVTDKDFRDALKQIEPSSLRDVTVEIPSTRWEEVGGLASVRRILEESVELPFKNPEVFEQMGIEPSRGILFYGPP
ncbi:cell division cycle protein 48, partial [mine drainage metagenome]